jgi:L-fuconolactonase
MKIDAHQHFWTLSRGDYGWLTADMPAIYRDFAPADLAPLIAGAGIERTVLVQAAPSQAETHFLLDLAEQTPFVSGVVGWVDFEAPDAAHRIAALAARPKLVGLRPMVQDLVDDEWLLGADIAPAVEQIAEEGLAFDALIKPRHLSVLRRFVERYPRLDVVIDHAAKPDIAGGGLEAWARDIRMMAHQTRVVCKLSGLITEAAPGWTAADLRPYVETLVEAFGADRLMWGSDWPVVNLNGSYGAWLDAAQTLLAELSADEHEAIFGRTAQVFYGLAE